MLVSECKPFVNSLKEQVTDLQRNLASVSSCSHILKSCVDFKETLGNFIAVLIYNTESTNGGALQLGISTSPRPIPPPIRRSGRYPKRKHVNYGKSDTCQTRSKCHSRSHGIFTTNHYEGSMSMECPSPCISTCTNQAISRGAFFDSNHLQVTTFGGKKGTSIVAQSLIKEETLVIEYTGKRSLTIDKGSSMKYMLQFKGGHIDGATDGNKPRFLNHSCDPNLGVAEWKVGQKLHIVMRATRDIEPGTELTFAYGRNADEVCCCETKNCSGKLGRKQKPLL